VTIEVVYVEMKVVVVGEGRHDKAESAHVMRQSEVDMNGVDLE
jgi:hypothetical protein